MATVGLVGLGLLGHAVASRLRAGGHAVVGYDVVPERVEALAALGGRGAGSVAEVARASEAVCTLLPSLSTVEEAILGPAGILSSAPSGQTVIQMSTISPALTERLARETAGRGLSFLDAPISGTSAMVERGEGLCLLGGERAVFDRWRPVLETVLRSVYVGAAGQAMVVKLAANLLVAVNTLAAAEALLMMERAGLAPDVVFEILTGGAASSRMLEVRGPLIIRRDFPAQMKLELFMKDLHLIQDAAAAVGAPVPLTDVAERLYAAASAGGHGAEDLSVVVRALEALTRGTPGEGTARGPAVDP
ncbi:MAG: NAD(P)-dependent oxidoreductase [Candidatus Rokubacteria bacterium]|nr:NAD(P)-dependent oxidoreductase [Candidatus Rokubacteria bacterium]